MFDKEKYQSEHKEIFDWYREKYKNRNSYLFVDGVSDAENYGGILFLLKEAYTSEDGCGECNLVSDLAEGDLKGMWGRVCEWTSGIENTTKESIFPFHRLSEKEKKQAFSHIAVINIKKVNGTPLSDDNDLKNYAEENAEMLKKEILGAEPKVIVCGNTFKYLKSAFDIKINKNNENWYYWVDIGDLKDVLVIDYYHPSKSYPALLAYYGITNIYQQALLNK